jgi:hypothetical protein
MYSIILLTFYVLYFPALRVDPDGTAARSLRRGLPLLLVLIGGYCFYEKLNYGEVRFAMNMNPLTLISLIQAYAALWFIHVMTSVNWILSSKNPAPWFRLPWQRGTSKLVAIIWNCFLCAGLVPFLWIHMIIVGILVWVYLKYKRSPVKQK